MPVSLTLLLTAAVLIAGGVYLLLERTLTRIIMGFLLTGNGVNLLFIIAAGRPGKAPFEGTADPADMSDPLPFAMVLTAIVIAMGMASLGMALAYRAWQLFGHDEVPDDVEDRRVLRRSLSRRGHSDESADGAPTRLAWGQALSEEARRGALLRSQGLLEQDPLGGDLSSAEDSVPDHTEADEAQVPRLPALGWRTRAARSAATQRISDVAAERPEPDGRAGQDAPQDTPDQSQEGRG